MVHALANDKSFCSSLQISARSVQMQLHRLKPKQLRSRWQHACAVHAAPAAPCTQSTKLSPGARKC